MAASRKKPRVTAVPAAYMILEKQGRVLMSIRRTAYYAYGKYQLPAGHLEEGELPEEAAIREAREEAGVIVSKKDLRFVHASYQLKINKYGNRVNYFFAARKWKGRIRNMEPDKTEDWQWVDPKKIPPDMIMPPVEEALKAYRRAVAYSGLGMEWIKYKGLKANKMI
jgi:8-oxo-dGTP pyrophosphatase MutT (NUDIX family)